MLPGVHYCLISFFLIACLITRLRGPATVAEASRPLFQPDQGGHGTTPLAPNIYICLWLRAKLESYCVIWEGRSAA